MPTSRVTGSQWRAKDTQTLNIPPDPPSMLLTSTPRKNAPARKQIGAEIQEKEDRRMKRDSRGRKTALGKHFHYSLQNIMTWIILGI